MTCSLTAAQCFDKYVVAVLPVIKRGQGWWSMRCPTGTHGKPLRLHTGDLAHITWTDLGHCPEEETYRYLLSKGIPSGCLKKPKPGPGLKRSPEFGTEDGKLAGAVLAEAFGSGTSTERLIRIAVLALGGECPEGPVCDVLADRLGLKPRIIYQATAELRRKSRG